ncbi:MAG: hypothetical protein ACKN9U_11870, partial [Pirellulaceae bacterium]
MSLLRVLTLGTNVFYSQWQNWHRLPNGLCHLPAYLYRLISIFGEDQNHHVALADAVDDRFPSLGPWSDVTGGNPALDLALTQPTTSIVCPACTFCRVTTENLMLLQKPRSLIFHFAIHFL